MIGASKCTRCGNERKTMAIFMVRPGGHTWFKPSADFVEASPPPDPESVCGDCLTDDEILGRLGPIMQFGLGALIRRIGDPAPGDPDIRMALSIAQTMFMVRNNDSEDQRGRRAAVKALGLAD